MGNNPVNFTDSLGMVARPGSHNISNWNGAMASEEATEGISPWPESSDDAGDGGDAGGEHTEHAHAAGAEEKAGHDSGDEGSDAHEATPQTRIETAGVGGAQNENFARTFSDEKTSIAAGTGFEPSGFQDPKRDNQNRSRPGPCGPNCWGHLNGFAIHIYNRGTPGTAAVKLYVPPGFDSVVGPGKNDAAVQFHYKELNGQKDITLVLFHVNGFHVDRRITNAMGNVLIGMSGGRGGKDEGYIHSCIQAFRGSSMPAKYDDRNAVRVSMRDLFRR